MWDGSTTFRLHTKVQIQEEDIPGGQKLLSCKHGFETCDICCEDYTMCNDMAKLESRNQLAQEARAEMKKELRKRCANPICPRCPDGDTESSRVKLSICGGCMSVGYCSEECRNHHYEEHKPICKSYAPKFPNSTVDGKQIQSYPRGMKVEQLYEGEPTGLVCRVLEFRYTTFFHFFFSGISFLIKYI